MSTIKVEIPVVTDLYSAMAYGEKIKERIAKEKQTHMGYDCSSFTFEAEIGDCYVPMGNLCTSGEIATEWCRSFILDKFTPNRILRSGPATIVFWADGTKTVVKRAPDEEDNAYAAFTAALAIKIFGSNSKLKKIVERKKEEQK